MDGGHQGNVPKLSGTEVKQRVKSFGSPYGQSTDWAVAFDDQYLTKLPKLGLGKRYSQWMGRKAGHVEDPTCPSFHRIPGSGAGQSYRHEFEPVLVPSKGTSTKRIGKGFKRTYNGKVLAAHDVSPADWYRFLQDIEVATRLSKSAFVWINIVPAILGFGLFGQSLSSSSHVGVLLVLGMLTRE